jgi:hypothetical protein
MLYIEQWGKWWGDQCLLKECSDRGSRNTFGWVGVVHWRWTPLVVVAVPGSGTGSVGRVCLWYLLCSLTMDELPGRTFLWLPG